MVRVAVGCKLGGVAERLGAVGAWVGAGRCVGPEVGCQLGAVAKGLWAVWAGVWAGATVREAVGCQLGGVGEGLGAVGARVGAGAAVGQPVRGQLGRVREGLVTVGAAVWALGRGPPSGSGRRRRGRGRPRNRLAGLLRRALERSSSLGYWFLASGTRIGVPSRGLCISFQHLACWPRNPEGGGRCR